MENLVGLLLVAGIILLIIGFFSPNASLFWYKQERTKKKSATIYGIAVVALFIILGATSGKSKDAGSSSDETAVADSTANPAPAPAAAPELTQAQKDSIAEVERLAMIKERKSQTFTAANLVQNYVDNEVRADENFKDKKFYVEGTVNGIKKGIRDEIYVTLEGASYRDVQCYFDDKATASKLEKGMRVTFLGVCDGLMMNVRMKNCELADNLKDLEKPKK